MGTTRITVLLTVVLLSAGCTSGPASTPSQPNTTADKASEVGTSEADSALWAWPEGSALPPLPVDANLRSYRLESCTGLGGALDVPSSFVSPYVPDSFVPFSLVPGTNQVFFQLLDCERGTFGRHVVQPFRHLLFGIPVEPRNESWEAENRPSRFFLEHFVSEPEAAEYFSGLGIETTGVNFSIERAPLESGGRSTWTLQLGSRSLSIDYVDLGPSERVSESKQYFWMGEKEFLRASHAFTYTLETLGATEGAMAFNGLGRVAEIVQVPRYTFTANPLYSAQGVGEVELFRFVEE